MSFNSETVYGTSSGKTPSKSSSDCWLDWLEGVKPKPKPLQVAPTHALTLSPYQAAALIGQLDLWTSAPST